MNKIWVGVAIGTVVGCFIAEIPQVKELIDDGKKQIKKMSK